MKPTEAVSRDWVARAAAARGEHVALESAAGVVTYAELSDRVSAAAASLAARGVGAGDRVGLALPAGEAFAVAFWAVLRLGAVAVPVDLRLGAGERAARVAGAVDVVDEGAVGELSAGDPGQAVLDSHPIPRSEQDGSAVAVVISTSGTSRAAKEVELTRGNLLASALGSAVALGLDREERWLCALPLSHVGGLSILVRSAIYATTAVVHDGWDTERVARALREDGITVVSLVPTMLARLLDAGLERPPGLRVALIGGAPLDPALAERARAAGVPVVETYGLSEACSQVATRGVPLPGVDVTLADDGEILVRGPIVAPGSAGPDGWLATGDLGELDLHGRLRVTGRKSSTIVTGGENVAPEEVEHVLREHPAVADAAVHGRPDDEWGEAVVATVVLREGETATEAGIRAHAATKLARFKVPKAIHFAPDLPRTESGKVRRHLL